MNFKLICGPPAAGKSEYCHRELLQAWGRGNTVGYYQMDTLLGIIFCGKECFYTDCHGTTKPWEGDRIGELTLAQAERSLYAGISTSAKAGVDLVLVEGLYDTPEPRISLVRTLRTRHQFGTISCVWICPNADDTEGLLQDRNAFRRNRVPTSLIQDVVERMSPPNKSEGWDSVEITDGWD